MHKTTQTVFRAEDAKYLLGNPGLQERLGGGCAALPAFLGAHCHGSIGELQKMGLPRSVCANDDVETFGELSDRPL